MNDVRKVEKHLRCVERAVTLGIQFESCPVNMHFIVKGEGYNNTQHFKDLEGLEGFLIGVGFGINTARSTTKCGIAK